MESITLLQGSQQKWRLWWGLGVEGQRKSGRWGQRKMGTKLGLVLFIYFFNLFYFYFIIGVIALAQKDPLEEGMATHTSILAWKIPWTEEPGSYNP